MIPFLKSVTETIFAYSQGNMENVLVIFPNRRPGLFMRSYFSEINKTAFFMPKIMGIDDFVEDLSELKWVDNEFLLFELFDIHISLMGENAKYKTFEEFISFADMMIRDFSEIDLYRVDARQLFLNLHELKAIGEWNISGEELTEFQQKYLQFYASLYQYYEQLNHRLLAQKKAYNGMGYRKVADNIEQYADQMRGEKIYFVGFNALSGCEEHIIKTFVQRGIAELITDGDDYYVSDTTHEAGYFLRLLRQKFGISDTYETYYNKPECKKINIVASPESIMQAKFAGTLLSESNIENTALVLADETLLIPVLNALPESVKVANITMGFPYTYSAIHTFVCDLFALHVNAKKGFFHYKDVVAVLSNTYVQNLATLHGNLRSSLLKILSEGNFLYISTETLLQKVQDLDIDFEKVHFLFHMEASNPNIFLSICRQFVQLLSCSKFFEASHFTKEREALASFLQITNHFEELTIRYDVVKNIATMQKIYIRMAGYHRISFYGEPLQGLQILGMLETRNLDFERVIILSSNEGILPEGKTMNSLIPVNLKKAFGMPIYREKDAIFAYHLYRLLQRTTESWLVYSTDSDGMGKGEPSRFILQIREELAQRYSNIKITEKVLSIHGENNETCNPAEGIKTPKVMQRLQQIAREGFSPSALNKYRNCQLRYYYENVLGVKEEKGVVEDIDNSELGTKIHKILEIIFQKDQYPNGILTVEVLQLYIDHLDDLIQENFKDFFENGHEQEGRNHFLVAIAKSQIASFLEKQRSEIQSGKQIQILGLEEKMASELCITVAGKEQTVRIVGTIDRIDLVDGNIRIVDYKSGKVNAADLKAKNINLTDGKFSEKWFQLMIYVWLYYEHTQERQPIIPGIYSLRNFAVSFMEMQWNEKKYITFDDLPDLRIVLEQCLIEIFDSTLPFRGNNDIKKCDICPFKSRKISK